MDVISFDGVFFDDDNTNGIVVPIRALEQLKHDIDWGYFRIWKNCFVHADIQNLSFILEFIIYIT